MKRILRMGTLNQVPDTKGYLVTGTEAKMWIWNLDAWLARAKRIRKSASHGPWWARDFMTQYGFPRILLLKKGSCPAPGVQRAPQSTSKVISSEHRSELEQPAIRHRSRDTCRLHIATTADPTLVTSQSRKEGHWRGWISAVPGNGRW
jgi:hypothetical protein